MASSPKQFALLAAQIRQLVPGSFGCFASDMITVKGRRVGYIYRQAPNQQWDSGWVFTAGNESQAFMDDAGNHGLYNVNTIANYDPDIIPLLNSPPGSAFERKGGTGPLVAAAPPPSE